jgi:hypothetical protein
MDESKSNLKKNPSRAACEKIIQRILMTEILEKGENTQFKNATDFMPFFESLYPTSASLTKQVQRAVKNMSLPKDKHGYFIINKSSLQLEEDQEISRILLKSNAEIYNEQIESVFIKIDNDSIDYLYNLIIGSSSFKTKYITMIKSSDGLFFLSKSSSQLRTLLSSLMRDQ